MGLSRRRFGGFDLLFILLQFLSLFVLLLSSFSSFFCVLFLYDGCLPSTVPAHPPQKRERENSEVRHTLTSTRRYIHETLSLPTIAAVGYCFGGKFVPRHMTSTGGIDIGFIAHPSNLLPAEIEAVAKPLSIAAGGTLSFLLCFLQVLLSIFHLPSSPLPLTPGLAQD